MAYDYFYDQQLRRYWLQFTRIFEGFQYQTGQGANGARRLVTVPVRLANKDQLVGHILRNNTENTVQSAPAITCWMTSITRPAERIQSPNFVSSVNVFEREIDEATNSYTGNVGRTYTVERMMGIPFDITMQVDVWTTNEDQKHQIMEQIMLLFNPSIDLQTGTNPLDWTGLTIVTLEDYIWSSRSFPMSGDDIEISSLIFKMPIWLNPPAKVKRQNIIHQIIQNIANMPAEKPAEGDAIGVFWDADSMRSMSIVTPGDHHVRVVGNEITLLDSTGSDEGTDWRELLRLYGKFRPGVSQFRLKTSADLDDTANDLVGTLSLDEDEANKAYVTWDIETLASNTLTAVNAMIDPHKTGPGQGAMPAAASGQRYIITDDLGECEAWGDINAGANDIIAYVNGHWSVVFDSSITTTTHYVLNSRSGKQLKWDGEQWLFAVDNDYSPGYWRVFL
jgi:hypothetical protein